MTTGTRGALDNGSLTAFARRSVGKVDRQIEESNVRRGGPACMRTIPRLLVALAQMEMGQARGEDHSAKLKALASFAFGFTVGCPN
jgi:hypothetical protein